MNYDITFCSKKNCPNKECKRNQINTEGRTQPIWIGNYEKCEYWEENE